MDRNITQTYEHLSNYFNGSGLRLTKKSPEQSGFVSLTTENTSALKQRKIHR